MKIGFIGAGKVGTAMGIYLKEKDIELVGYYSRRISSTTQAAQNTNSRAFENLEDLVKEVDAIAITTSDDVISDIARTLSEIPGIWEEKIVFHMSGVHTSEVLSPLAQKGTTVCSLHPMLSFSDASSAAKNLKFATFTLEGSGNELNIVKKQIEAWGNPLMEISTNDKVLYHTAASIVSNYLVTIIDTGIQMLITTGFTEEDAKKLVEPLIRKTLDNVMVLGTEKALTGPISRGDVGTVEKHVDKLFEDDNSLIELYKALGHKTINLAKRAKKIDDSSAVKLEEVLNKYE